MNSERIISEALYDNRVEARRRYTSAQGSPWDRFDQPTIIISTLLLLVAAYCHFNATPLDLATLLSRLLALVWDVSIFLTPAWLLNTLDSWLNPSMFPRPLAAGPASTHASKSETARRILGLEQSGGMMSSVFDARTRAFSMTGSVLGLKSDFDRPPGLGNRDNSCYQNSVLQGLSALKTFPEYLDRNVRRLGSDEEKGVAQTLRTLLSDLNDGSNNGKTLWTPHILKSMSTWTQQDAQEYYSKVLDDIDKGLARVMQASHRHPGFETEVCKDETTASQHSDDSGYQSLSSSSKSSNANHGRNPLEGLLAQRVACVQCGHSDGLSLIPFNCLTLSLGLDQNQHDLYERLDSYSKVESIEGVECPKCTLLKAQRLLTKLVEKLREGSGGETQLAEPLRRLEAVDTALEEDEYDDETISDRCKISAQGKVTTTKTKQIVIARPPQSLVIHMNRSVFDPSTFHMMKNSAPVDFPLTLDLGPWCLGSTSAGSSISALEIPDESQEVEEQWLQDPRESMVAGDMQPSRLTGPIYELRAAVTHYGRHENGHYICYRKYPRFSQPVKEQAKDSVDSERGGEDEDAAVDDATEGSEKDPESQHPEADGSAAMDWWRLSDHNVSKVSEQTVLGLSPGVFMLFYDCVDPSVVPNPDFEDAQETRATQAQQDATSTTVKQPMDVVKPEHGEGTSSVAATEDETLHETDADEQPLPVSPPHPESVPAYHHDGVESKLSEPGLFQAVQEQ